MQLGAARLCLDCEEIHDQQSCPVCTSESFAFVSRWIPRPEGHPRPRPAESREVANTYRELISPTPPSSGGRRWAKRGVFGLAAVGLAGWLWRQNTPAADERKPEAKSPTES
jgi:hypothetical protein